MQLQSAHATQPGALCRSNLQHQTGYAPQPAQLCLMLEFAALIKLRRPGPAAGPAVSSHRLGGGRGARHVLGRHVVLQAAPLKTPCRQKTRACPCLCAGWAEALVSVSMSPGSGASPPAGPCPEPSPRPALLPVASAAPGWLKLARGGAERAQSGSAGKSTSTLMLQFVTSKWVSWPSQSTALLQF